MLHPNTWWPHRSASTSRSRSLCHTSGGSSVTRAAAARVEAVTACKHHHHQSCSIHAAPVSPVQQLGYITNNVGIAVAELQHQQYRQISSWVTHLHIDGFHVATLSLLLLLVWFFTSQREPNTSRQIERRRVQGPPPVGQHQTHGQHQGNSQDETQTVRST